MLLWLLVADLSDQLQPDCGHVLVVGELLGPACHLQPVLVRRKEDCVNVFSRVEPS